MSLFLFCLVMLSAIFTLVFGFWWDSSAPFKVHLSVLASLLAMLLSAILIINIYPKIQRRSAVTAKDKHLDNVMWGQDISSKLSTPAAVIEGYNIKFANNAFLKELGMSGMREFITEMPLTNLVHPSNHNALANFISQQHDLQSNETITLRMLYADGTTIPVHMSLSPLNATEQPNQYLLQFSLTSSSEPATSSVSEELTYHLLIDRIEQIVFQINVDQELIFLNPSWQRLLDYSTEESLNKTLFSFIHPEDQPLAESRLNALTEGKRQQCQFELRLIAKNGRSLWVELRASTTSTLKGERTSIMGTLTDISRMKQTEAGLKANARSTTDMIMTNIPCMLYRCKNDRNWTFDFVSEGCLEVTEYQPYEITNSLNFNYMQLIYPEDQPRVWEHVQNQINKQRSFQLVYRILTRSNKIKWVMERGKGIFSGSDELLTLEGVIIDITSDNFHELMYGLEQIIESPCPYPQP
ncbi:PAS domain-containing protein [Methylophaga sp. OBS4]|uniref:PAS domain-containing protein n=1 Tax=Methylophaga sp. OBS4 TaxID=2991935 RepID=UPI00225682A0|nr:PAS domain-containing protein [Methylophaga sp. OBS4]MCX4187069.1 PAS domain-containing protein [Methylophaga sp. OBS4]